MTKRRANSRPTVVDLFSGAGGFSLGFHAAGCSILAAVDADAAAASTFRHNFTRLQPDRPPRVFGCDGDGDLTKLGLSSIAKPGQVDILVGGPPCQGFSLLGRAKLEHLYETGKRDTCWKEDPRNQLYATFMEAAGAWQPSAVVMENVTGMLTVKGQNVARLAAIDLEEQGYNVGYAVLNAVHYGVPQFRERLFVIGIRKDLELHPILPAATHDIKLPAGYSRSIDLSAGHRQALQLNLLEQGFELLLERMITLQAATTVSDALDDLPAISAHLEASRRPASRDFRLDRSYDRPPGSMFSSLMREGWPGIPTPQRLVDHIIRRTPRDYRIFQQMQPGDTYPEAIRIARRLLDEELARLGPDAPAEGSDAYRELEKKFVPPYPVDKFLTKWQKLKPGEPSWTVTAHLSKDSYSHIHHDREQQRAISVREAARLQSFPDGFEFSGNMGDCFRQIGNAVPPLLSWAIAARLLQQLGYQARAPWQDLETRAGTS